MKIYKNNDFKNTFLFMAVCLSVIITLVSFIVYTISANKIIEQMKTVELERLNSYENTVYSKVRDIHSQLIVAIKDDILTKEYSELDTVEIMKINHFFLQEKFFTDYVDCVSLYYAKDDLVISTPSTFSNGKKSWKEIYLSNAPLGLTPLFMPYQNEDGAYFSVMMGFPYGNAEKIGAMIYQLNADKLFGGMIEENSGKAIFVLDENNEIIYGNRLLCDGIRKSKKFVEMCKERLVFDRFKVNGEDALVTVVNSRLAHYRYVSVVDERVLFKDLHRVRNITILSSILFLLFGYLIFGKLLKSVYSHVYKMIEKIKIKNSEGDAGMVKSIGGFHQLNELIDHLMETNDKIKDFNIKNKRSVILGVLVNLCHCYIDEEEEKFILESLVQAGFPVEGRRFAAIVIDLGDNISNEIRKAENVSLNKVADDSIDIITLFTERARMVGLVSYNGDFELLMRFVNLLHEDITRKFHVNVVIGIGNSCERLRDFYTSYEEAVDALEYNRVKDFDIVHINDCILKDSETKFYFPVEKEESLFRAIKSADADKAEDILEEIYGILLFNNKNNQRYVVDAMWQLMPGIIRCLNTMGINYEDIFEVSYADEYQRYCQNQDYTKSRDFISGRVRDMISYIKKTRDYSGEVVAQKIKQYIDENYGNPLSRDELAAYVKLTPAYASSLFKQNIGEGIREYIARVRMEKAAELIMTTNQSLEVIGTKVGYEVSRSFFRAFKSYYGVTPSQYKTQK